MLLNFPPEILGLILGSWNSSHLIIVLWLCGDSRLHSLLARGVTYVNLRQTEARHIPRIPAVLCHLPNLQTLSVSSRFSLMLYPLIERLSPSLETLELNCFGALFLASGGDSNDPNSKTFDWAKHFPRLRALSLESEHSMTSGSLLTALPASITRFSTHYIRIDGKHPRMWANMPRTLIFLDALVEVNWSGLQGSPEEKMITDDWRLALPPHIEGVGHLTWNEWNLAFQWIPPSFTRGTISELRSGRYSQHYGLDASLRMMPSNMESLNIDMPNDASPLPDYEKWLLALPRRLSSLGIQGRHPLGANCILLPRSLTSLTLKLPIDWDSLSPHIDTETGLISPAFWPPGLKSLSCEVSLVLDDFIHLLPQSLLSLVIQWSLIRAPTKAVTKSSGPDLDSKSSTGPSNGFRLPPGLQKLHIQHNGVYNGLGQRQLECLPDSLFDLQVFLNDSFNQPAPSSWELPSRLTSLTVTLWHRDAFPALPRSLTHLMISQLHGPLELYTDVFRELPHRLSSLNIAGYAKTRFQDVRMDASSFSTLPDLHSLIVNLLVFPSLVLKNMPKSLRILHIQLTEMDPANAQFIPPLLTQCRLDAFFDPEHALIKKHWPALCRSDLQQHRKR